MSQEINAKLIYGIPAKLITKIAVDGSEDLASILEEHKMTYASPYYDSPQEDWIVGFELEGSRVLDHKYYYEGLDEVLSHVLGVDEGQIDLIVTPDVY